MASETEDSKVKTVELNLSMNRIDDPFNHPDQVSGSALTYRVYTFEGVTNEDGSLRQLSIGQLVMALCLARASELEAQIIELMEEMNKSSAQLEALTEVEEGLVAVDDSQLATYVSGEVKYDGKTYTYVAFLKSVFGITVPNDMTVGELITEVEAKMDELNSFSQQKMIELQSLTNKRDQSYDMISNVLKSLHTTLIGNVNNM